MLEGARAVPQPGGRFVVVSDAKLQTFRETGESEMIVEAPECTYDQNDRSINSTGPLRLRSADGQFYLEGEGFLWRQNDQSLFVSNKVHTIVRSDLVNGQPSAKTNSTPSSESPIDIFFPTDSTMP